VPTFFTEEIATYQSSHLVVGIESRNNKGLVLSRWSASAVEVDNESETHLEFCIRSHLNLQGKKVLMFLLELGHYLECTNSNIILPPLKSVEDGEKFGRVLSLIGFQKVSDSATASITSTMVNSTMSSGSFGKKKGGVYNTVEGLGGIMSYIYPSGVRIPSPKNSPNLESF
jgi:hypothetical protein